MSSKSDSETSPKRSRYEMESSQPSNNSSLSIESNRINDVDCSQNALKPFSDELNSNDENSSKLLEMQLEIKMMRSQLQNLTKRMNDIEVEHAADAINVTNVSVDFSELDIILDTVDDVNRFESKLKSKDFKTVVLNSLVRIGGTSGTMDANKVVRTVFSTLFDEQIKRKYTWIGHGGRAAFKDLHEIRKLIFEVIVQADHRYSLMQCNFDITHRLLKPKRSPTRRGTLNSIGANINLSADNQTLNDLSDANNNNSIPRIVEPKNEAMTPTRAFNPNDNDSDQWS